VSGSRLQVRHSKRPGTKLDPGFKIDLDRIQDLDRGKTKNIFSPT